jgi:ECF sigma factor
MGTCNRLSKSGNSWNGLKRKTGWLPSSYDMRYFAGYTIEEVAKHTGLDERSVRHRWDKASMWLKKQIGD